MDASNPERRKSGSSSLSRWIGGTLLAANLVLLVIVAKSIRDFRAEMAGLKEALADRENHRATTGMLEQVKSFQAPCTRCHTEERFSGLHGDDDEITQLIARMRAHPDARITDAEAEKIHDSLLLQFKCQQCHSGEMMEKLSRIRPEHRLDVIRRMVEKPDSQRSVDEAKHVLKAWENLLGF